PGNLAGIVLRDEPSGHPRRRALQLVERHRAVDAVRACVVGIDRSHVPKLAVVAGDRAVAEAGLQCERERAVPGLIDLERTELLDVSIARRVETSALVVHETAVVAAGEIFIRPKKPLDVLDDDDVVDGIGKRCEIGAACVELEGADLAAKYRSRIEERAKPGSVAHVQITGEYRESRLGLEERRGGVPRREVVRSVDKN